MPGWCGQGVRAGGHQTNGQGLLPAGACFPPAMASGDKEGGATARLERWSPIPRSMPWEKSVHRVPAQGAVSNLC